jgi:spore coat polysaccharide biosynthesis protein SpsF
LPLFITAGKNWKEAFTKMAAKVIGIITARMSSKRLPGKVMRDIAGKSMFAHHVERLLSVEGLDGIFLATSKDPSNDELIEEAKRLGCGWYAGQEQDVVQRHLELCKREQADAFVRVPCDSPLFDIDSASVFVKEFRHKYRDYIYVKNMTMINGTVKELVSRDAMATVHEHYRGPAITTYIVENIAKLNTLGIEIAEELCRPEYRLTVDVAVDLEMINQIYKALYKGKPLMLRDVYAWLDDNPHIALMNRGAAVSEVNRYFADLTDKPLFTIIERSGKPIIIDNQRQIVELPQFIKQLKKLFPKLEKDE